MRQQIKFILGVVIVALLDIAFYYFVIKICILPLIKQAIDYISSLMI